MVLSQNQALSTKISNGKHGSKHTCACTTRASAPRTRALPNIHTVVGPYMSVHRRARVRCDTRTTARAAECRHRIRRSCCLPLPHADSPAAVFNMPGIVGKVGRYIFENEALAEALETFAREHCTEVEDEKEDGMGYKFECVAQNAYTAHACSPAAY